MTFKQYLRQNGYEQRQDYGRTKFAQENPNIYPNGFHNGVDYIGGDGVCISLTNAEVIEVHEADDNPYGRFVKVLVDTDTFLQYCHLGQIDTRYGKIVGPGERIGTIGSTGLVTGAHVHLMAFDGGDNINPKSVVMENNKKLTNTEDMSNEEFLKYAYKGLLGRNPDGEGQEYYLDRLENEEMEADDVMRALVKSEEFVKNHVKISID